MTPTRPELPYPCSSQAVAWLGYTLHKLSGIKIAFYSISFDWRLLIHYGLAAREDSGYSSSGE